MYKQYLLVQNIVIGVSYERSVIRVEKLLTRNLSDNNKHSVIVWMRPCTMTITSTRVLAPETRYLLMSYFAMLNAQKCLTGNC